MSSTSPENHALDARIRGHLELARISNAPTVLTNVLVGVALAGGPLWDLRVGALWAAMLLMYVGGMYLNDVCDFEFDCRHRPDRPLVREVVSRREARWTAAIALGLGGAVLASLGTATGVCAVVLVALIVIYNLWHKNNRLAPLVMGLIRATVYVGAFSAFAPIGGAKLWVWAALLCAYILGLTALSATETDPSRASWLPGGLLAAPAVYFLLTSPGPVAFLLAAVFTGWVAHCLGHASPSGGREVGRAIGGLLAGICLLDALALASTGSTVAVLVALAGFALTRRLHRFVKGT